MNGTGSTKSLVSVNERRDLLLEAALEVMKREGISAATTRAICKEAGVSHGVFHYCFRTKHELFAALLKKESHFSLTCAWEKISKTTQPRSAIKILFRTYWSRIEEDPSRQLSLFELTNYSIRNPDISGIAIWEQKTYRNQILKDLTELSHRLNISFSISDSMLAEMILSSLLGITLAWTSHKDDDLAISLLDSFASFFSSCYIIKD